MMMRVHLLKNLIDTKMRYLPILLILISSALPRHLPHCMPRHLATSSCQGLEIPEMRSVHHSHSSFGDLPAVVLRLLPCAHSHHLCQLSVPFRSQCLCQSVRRHVLHWTVFQPCRSILNTVPDEVILNVDVLCTCMMFQIVSKGDSALIVTVDDILVADVVAYFLEEAEEPDWLLECVEESHIF